MRQRKIFTLRRVPLAPVESALSLPAKSTRLILLTCQRQCRMMQTFTSFTSCARSGHCKENGSIMSAAQWQKDMLMSLLHIISWAQKGSNAILYSSGTAQGADHLASVCSVSTGQFTELPYLRSWKDWQGLEQTAYLLRGVIRLCIVALLGEDDVEDSMRATACFVHIGGRHCPVRRMWGNIHILTRVTKYLWALCRSLRLEREIPTKVTQHIHLDIFRFRQIISILIPLFLGQKHDQG